MSDQIQRDFERFHRDNPQVYELWDRFTRQMIRRGFSNGSAKLIAERIRWETAVETVGEPVKLNNNYSSRYARRWEEKNPGHRGFFRKRVLQAHSANSIHAEDLI